MVGLRCGSCDTTRTSSLVTATSISRKSTPTWMAYSNAGIVFSGRIARAPRWPCTRIFAEEDMGISAASSSQKTENVRGIGLGLVPRLFRYGRRFRILLRDCIRTGFTGRFHQLGKTVWDGP